ncbi:uncharacterized protein A1O9_10715 [Exophiala aquamarina CBS 119918]|uniref:Uncharacterized protein n=1 Tax=Exophiala aquamarina CBS 119918 TaxID=1182545 RepID=A0A072P0T5_9EURO|nr:uncharacterized protein A1O9_10715 [Exophiala aquamarina CBS 119918]KEF53267.1 hypothetical protein A1O9_10715 [Exophiala aquamarina CBS 119918]
MRYLAACAASEQWLIITLSVLAKQSMKLEVLEKDPPAYAKMSQEAEEDLNDEQEQHRYLSILEKPSSLISDTDKFLEMDQIYHFEEWYIRDTINWLFLYMLSAIGGSSPTTDGGSCFEMSTRVYRTGMSSSPLVISSDWDGEYSASSDAQRIRYCRSALDILLLNTREIAKHKSHTSRLVQIQWDFEGSRDPEYRPVELQHQACTQRQFSISSMDDALSMIMPLALCNAHAAIEAFCMITTTNISCVSTGKPRSREYIDEHFLAKFSFTTSAYNKAQQKIGTSPGYKSLQKANSREERLVPSCSLESTNERDCDWPTFKKQMDTTSEWKLDETCVIVECGPYVWTIMGIALFIVIGGLAVPFSSHVRLEGVDPFNITTFVWLLVAFFVLIAKSRYVPNWAWHDFLHRRIICRTVTELANVTAMDPQLVIHKLLVSENSSVLGTRGPHNSMFKLQRPNGFSIDVPVKTPTLYTNGFVLFRCLGKVDQHIVCLDARPIDLTSTSLLVAEHRPTQKSFGCRLPAPSQPVPSNGMKLYMDVLKLTEREYEGDRILGLFLAGAEFG